MSTTPKAGPSRGEGSGGNGDQQGVGGVASHVQQPRQDAASESDLGVVEISEQAMETRLNRLREKLRAERGAVRVTNPNFEIGRPELKPADDMKMDPSNLYNRPSIDMLSKIKPRSISNNMATSQDMMKIVSAIEGMGVPSECVQQVIIQAVIYCKDASSSVYLDPTGVFEWKNGGAIMADSVLAILKRDAETLRRVCRLYAPITWNFMLVHDAPPSDWAAMGFSRDTKFAAFDCFDYVENKAAVQPLEGLIRVPTPAEKIAHSTHKTLALDRANRNATYGNFQTEITGGRLGPEIVRNFNNANNK